MAYSVLRTLVNRAGIVYDELKTHVVFAEDMNAIKGDIEYLESNRSAISIILNAANLGSGYLTRWDGSKLVNSKIYDNGTNVGIGTTGPTDALSVWSATDLGMGYYRNSTTYIRFNHSNGLATMSTAGNSSGLAITSNGSEAMRILANGNVGIATTSPTAKLDILSDILRLRTAKTPATAGAAGNQGDMCWDSGYLYICVSTNAWVRSALATW